MITIHLSGSGGDKTKHLTTSAEHMPDSSTTAQTALLHRHTEEEARGDAHTHFKNKLHLPM